MQHSIEMIKDLRLASVAEGVETKEMADNMIAMGCDYIQGFSYSKPVFEEEFISFIKNANQKS